ncbi:hypothetical protein [Mesorhizobium sp. M0019]|uniref:NACHT domain-containing protein n=1 Tax=Mesorhizobium sp. M0019 TaxID=2956845 RepID=UPI0033370D54
MEATALYTSTYESPEGNYAEIDPDLIEEGYFEEDIESYRVLKTIVDRCSDKFNRSTVDDHKGCREKIRNRVVLMGGPGQGKSTIGQFLAQIYRAKLLEILPNNSPDINSVIKAILDRAASEGISLKGLARFPFVVDLPAFADALNSATKAGRELPLLSYISLQVGRDANALTVTALRRWLSAVPTIFILDGLDEVPHASNRGDVIEAVNSLIDEIYELNADSFTLVTSRPQGYQDEFSRRTWAHWEMADLSSADAIKFGQQLAVVLVPDETRRQEIIQTLSQATKDDATAPLMTSPLQVSLLFALVETRNNIPKDRWTLFYRYYEILRDREIAKGGENGKLIGEYKGEIDRLHYEAGYLLQLRGEGTGNANPFLNPLELAGVIRQQLTKSGYDDDLEILTQKIVNLVTMRLVFLRCKTAERIAFDVRSLQEFMAAARLMASPEDKIRRRLKEIAGISHWSHVFKIACSKVYSSAELESLREEILSILDSLDAGDRAREDSVIQSGALLAVQMLIDGVAGAVPTSKRNLIVRGMRLLRSGNPQAPFQLAKAIDFSALKTVEVALAERLRDGGSHTASNSLRLLLLLMHSTDAAISNWASEYVKPWLPSEPTDALALITSSRFIPPKGPVLEWLQKALWRSGIAEVRYWHTLLGSADKPSTDDNPFHLMGLQDRRRSNATLLFNDGTESDIYFRFRRMDEVVSVPMVPSDAHEDWNVLSALNNLVQQRTPRDFMNFLSFLAERPDISLPAQEMPWVVLAALNRRKWGDSFSDIGLELQNGLWANEDNWQGSERRWVESGVSVREFHPDVGSRAFFPAQLLIPVRRPPSSRNRRENAVQRRLATLDAILAIDSGLPGSAEFSARMVAWYCRIHRGLHLPDNVLLEFQRRAEIAKSDVDLHREILANCNVDLDQFETAPIQVNLQHLVSKISSIPNIPAILCLRFLKSFIKDNSLRHLLVLASGSLPLFPSQQRVFDEFFRIDVNANVYDDDVTIEAITLLRLANGEDVNPDDLKTVTILRLRRILEKSRLSREHANEVLRTVSFRRLVAPTTGTKEYGALQTLMDMVEKTKSRLHVPAVCDDLRLPTPI